MITLIIVKNPFKSDREIKKTEYVPGKPVYEYIQPYFMGVDVVASRNGEIVPEEEYHSLIPAPGDYIAVCPVIEGSGDSGKDVARAVAFIALTVATMGVGSMVAGGAFWGAGAIGAANWGFWSWAAAVATYAAGGYLINQLFPPRTPEERKQTYGWALATPNTVEGEAIPITFGKVKMGVMAPIQMLSQRVTTDSTGEKQYLNLLLCGGEGPVDSISDLRINDNPYNNYTGVTFETRLGTNDQNIISNFNDTYFPQSLSYKLEKGDDSIVHQLNGEFDGFEVTISLPAGLFRSHKGELKNNSVTINIRYRKVGTSTWTSAMTKTISGKYTHAVTRMYTVHNLEKARYEVNVRVTSKDYDGEGDAHEVYWTVLSGILYDDFTYPNRVLVGLKALATDQLSGGLPRISWVQERKNVWVWNPNTGSYEQKPANNPAWACYDIIHRCRRLRNIGTGQYEHVVEGVPANRIDYQAFLDWANFCTDKELQYNGVIYTTQTLWDALRTPEQAGRGRVLMRGTKFSCICDAPSEPVQLFTVSNIGIDSFREEYLGTSERANAIELTFYNLDNNYEETTIPIYGPGYDELTAVSNPTQVRLDFAMTLEQAYRYGAYQLRVNHYINRAVTWSADIDAIACQAGDVVLLQHDVPRWGWGGRIVSATESTVTLDQKITLYPGIEYGILIRLADDTIVEKRIEGVIEEMALDTLTVNEPFDSVPQPGDMYSFGEIEKVAKPFRLTSISRADDFRCTLQGIEYIEEVYEEAEDIPVVDYTRPDDIPNPWAPPARVHNLRLYEEMNQLKDGTWLPALRVSWTKPVDPFWKYGNIYISEEGSENWEFVQKVEGVEYVIPSLKHDTRYTVKVVSESRYNITEDFEGATTASITLHGKSIPPGDVQDFNIQVLGNGDVLLNWSEVPPTGLGGRGIAGYEIRRGTTWGQSVVVQQEIKANSYNLGGLQPGEWTFLIKAVDTSGNYSLNPAMATITTFDTTIKNVVQEFEDDFSEGEHDDTKRYVIDGKVSLATAPVEDVDEFEKVVDTAEEWGQGELVNIKVVDDGLEIPLPNMYASFDADATLVTSDGVIHPDSNAIYTLRPGEGKIGGCVEVKEGTVNLVDNPTMLGESGLHSWFSAYGTSVVYSIEDEAYIPGTKSQRIQYTSAKNDGVDSLNRGISFSLELTIGETYTFSFYGKNWEEKASMGLFLYNLSTATLKKENLGDGWIRYALTFKVGDNPIGVYIRPNGNRDYSFDVLMNAPQLEPKPYATPFTESTRPDDLLPYPVSLSDNYDNYTISCYRKAPREDEWKHVAIRSDGKVFIDGVEDSGYDVGWIAGRNLVLNSNFKNGLEGWTTVGAVTVVSDSIYGSVCKVEATSSLQGIYRPPTIGQIPSGETITMRAIVRADAEMSVGIAIDGSGLAEGITKTIGTAWTEISITKVSTGVNTQARVYANSPGTLYIARIKVERGSTATDWTPAPEDLGYEGNMLMFTKNTGLLDELAIYDGLRSEEEIAHWHETGIFKGYREEEITLPAITADSSIIGWEESLNNQTVKVETNLSLDGGQTWLGWKVAENGKSIPDVAKETNLSGAILKIRITLTTGDWKVSPRVESLLMRVYPIVFHPFLLSGTYTSPIFDLGKVKEARAFINYATGARGVDLTWQSYGNITWQEFAATSADGTWMGLIDAGKVKPALRYSADGEDWRVVENFINASVYARYFQVKIELTNTSSLNQVYMEPYTLVIDVEDVVDGGITTVEGEATIYYNYEFYSKESVKSIKVQVIGDNDYQARVLRYYADRFDVKVVDSNGNPVTADVSWTVLGY